MGAPLTRQRIKKNFPSKDAGECSLDLWYLALTLLHIMAEMLLTNGVRVQRVE